MTVRLLVGDALTRLRELPDASAVACITSPPYWRQRNYLPDGHPLRPIEMGQEPTPEAWAANLVGVFREVRRALTPDGCLWLVVGDKYAAGGMGGGGIADGRKNWRGTAGFAGWRSAPEGYKQKDLSLAPFKLAEALRADGWYLRQAVIWRKSAAVEPPRLDRPSVSHEYLFLLTVGQASRVRDPGEPWWFTSVWTIHHGGGRLTRRGDADRAGAPLRRGVQYRGRHPDIDPFVGSGTVALTCDRLGRHCVGIELNPESARQAQRRIESDAAFPGMAEVEATAGDYAPLGLFGEAAP